MTYITKLIHTLFSLKHRARAGIHEPMAQENKNWLKKNQIGSNLRKVRLSEYTATPL